MFSAHLLYYVGGRCHELLPSRQSVDVKLVSSRGEGKCLLQVDVSQKEAKELLLYIPSYLRCENVLYCCRVTNVNVRNGEYGLEDEHKATEMVLKDREALKGKGTHKQRLFSKVKSHFKQLVCNKDPKLTTSSEDFILGIQDIPSQSVLYIEVQFLLELKPTYCGSSNCVPVSCCWNNRTSFSYNLEYVSPYSISSVRPSGEYSASFNCHVYGTDRNFARLSFRGSHESVTRLEFQIEYCLTSSPTLLVASSKGPLHQNGSSNNEHFVLLEKSFNTEHDSRVAQVKFPSEFIFLVDCSGSMCGANIQGASDSLILFIKSLPTTCYFNVIAFGSTFRNLFENSQKYSQETMEKAISFADKLQASLGGTELLNPLHWALKKPVIEGMPRQVFILTDGAVTNTKAVLREVQKYNHQARCHTFGIGSEVCHELVLGVAALSNGRHVLVNSKERIQEKVIATLEESLKPALTDVNITWHPPPNCSVAETLHGYSGAVFNGGCVSYWGRVVSTGNHHSADGFDSCAVITGTLGNVHKFEKSFHDISDVTSIVTYSTVERLVAWLKILELERKLAICRRRSQDEQFLTEDDKSQSDYAGQQLSELSRKFLIPCSLNCIVSKDTSFLSVQQIIPDISSQTKSTITPVKPVRHCRPHNGSSKSCHMSDRPSFLPAPNSLGTVLKGAVSSVSNSLKSLISNSLDSVFGPGCQDMIEDGQRIDDEIKIQNSGDILRWGPEGDLIHPKIYYPSDSSVQTSNGSKSSDTARKRKSDYPAVKAKLLKLDDTSTHTSQLACMSISDDSYVSAQASLMDCHMEVARQPMVGPAAMMPLIHMQSYDGPWHLSEAFASAIGISHKQVDEFIQLQSIHTGLSYSTSAIHCNGNGHHSCEHESYWATVLAVVCLQVHFSNYQAEWKLLVQKATGWLEQVGGNFSVNSSIAIEHASSFTHQMSIESLN